MKLVVHQMAHTEPVKSVSYLLRAIGSTGWNMQVTEISTSPLDFGIRDLRIQEVTDLEDQFEVEGVLQLLPTVYKPHNASSAEAVTTVWEQGENVSRNYYRAVSG